MKKYGAATITCAEPGCTQTIRYEIGDMSVPLYCEKHRTKEGRHAAMRKVR